MPISFIPYTSLYGPLSIGASCTLWLDAADTTTLQLSGSSVVQWNDKSGNMRNASGGVSPTYSPASNAIVFNGTSSYLTVPAATYAPLTAAFCVINYTGTTEGTVYRRGLTTGNTFEFGLSILNTTQIRTSIVLSGTSREFTVGTSTTQQTMFCSTWDSSMYSLLKNGNTLTSGTQSGTESTSSQPIAIGQILNDIGQPLNIAYFTGNIYEIIFFNSVLSTTQRQAIEGYLAQKWGLTANLPPYHPALSKTFYNGRVYQPQISLKPAPYANYFPLSLTGCQLWLDGADSTTVTGTSTVTAWRDKSGLNYTAINNLGTSSVSAASLNGLNTIYVPSGANLKIANFLFYTNFTTFIVGKAAAANLLIGGLFGTNGIAFYEFTGNGDLLAVPLPSGTTFLDVYDNVGVPVSANTWFIWCIGYNNLTNSTASPYRVNGNARTTLAGGGSSIVPSSSGTGNLYLNSTNGANSYDSDYFAEIIHYNTTLTTAQCQGIEGYLAWKWGLQATNLPVTHPYYSAAPLQYTRGAILGAPTLNNIARLPPVVATGGTITFSGRYKIHTFTTVGSTNFTITQPYSTQLQVLIVGGGGGGGGDRAAGGGGGGLIFLSNTTITSGTYSVTVGDGGLPGWWGPNGGNGRVAGNGGNSIFNGNIAIGGGGAGQHQYYLNGVYQNNGEPYYGAGRAGGSGGGGAAPNPSYPTALGGSPTVGQGYTGGSGFYNGSICCAGGGGGAGGPGGNGLSAAGGAGGPGLQVTIGGTTAYYAGGGGGAAAQDYRAAVGGAGGVGGGGQADQSASVSGTAGTNGLGGGGGGAGNGSGWAGSSGLGGNVAGFAGGSGVVIIAYDYL